MDTIVDRLEKIKLKISSLKPEKIVNVIAVSKTFPISNILPLIKNGHMHFGENKVQEALEKWTNIKNEFNNVKLHMFGNLQTNKVKECIKHFDFIHSLDSKKLAKKIYEEEIKQNKKIKIFIQVNIGQENQKSGANISELEELLLYCYSLKLDMFCSITLPISPVIWKKKFAVADYAVCDFNQCPLSRS